MILDKVSIRRQFFKYAVPSIVAMWVFSVYTMVDGFFVAKYVGESALAAINVSLPFVNGIFALAILFATGAATLVGISLGGGDEDRANRIFNLTIAVEIIFSLIGIVFCKIFLSEIVYALGAPESLFQDVYSYLSIIVGFSTFFIVSYNFEVLIKTDGFPRRATLGVALSAFTNIMLDYIFVGVLNLGVSGAAWATGIAQVGSTILFAYHFAFGNSKLKFSRKIANVSIMKAIIPIGFGSFLMEFSGGFIVLLYNHYIMLIIGETGLITYTVLSYTTLFVISTMLGLTQGMQPLVSFSFGRQSRKTYKYILRITLVAAFVLSVISYFASNFFSEQLISLFISRENNVLTSATKESLSYYSPVFLCAGLNTVIGGYCAAIGKSKQSLLISLLRGFILIWLALEVARFINNAEMLWLSDFIAEFVTLIISSALLMFSFKGSENNIISSHSGNAVTFSKHIPEEIHRVIEDIESQGFKAYFVGGCVRDFIMGIDSKDYDISTSAKVDDIKNIFGSEKLITIGEKHGTIGIMRDGHRVEITTLRKETSYTDSRHPDSVEFVDSVELDLARRDFTINAMAYSMVDGLIDPYRGLEDIKMKTIRCVGTPQVRFREDSLRILRALRFASVTGFEIESSVAECIREMKSQILLISAERIRDEFSKLICGENVYKVLVEFPEVISTLFPELRRSIGFEQNNRHHIYDVYEHTARVVQGLEPDLTLRLAALLHDCAKPETYKEDDNGEGHFKGHAKLGADKAKTALKRLRFDNKTSGDVVELIYMHSTKVNSDRVYLKKLLAKMGEEHFFMLMKLKRADDLEKSPDYTKGAKDIDEMVDVANDILRAGECIGISGLNIDGNILKTLGIKQGKEIGIILDMLLEMVLENQLENKRSVLESAATNIYKSNCTC